MKRDMDASAFFHSDSGPEAEEEEEAEDEQGSSDGSDAAAGSLQRFGRRLLARE